MVNVFYKNRSTVGNLVIALLFIGGCVFVLTGSWNAPKTVAASGCCGGTITETALARGCCGGGTDTVSDSDSEKCQCVSSGTNCSTDDCDPANNDTCNNANPKRGCPDQRSDGKSSCQNTSTDGACLGNSCDRNICTRADQCDGKCDER